MPILNPQPNPQTLDYVGPTIIDGILITAQGETYDFQFPSDSVMVTSQRLWLCKAEGLVRLRLPGQIMKTKLDTSGES